MSAPIVIQPKGLAELSGALRQYAFASRKSFETIIADEARQVAWELYSEFKKLSPKPSALLSSAVGRSWRMGRVGNALTASEFGISRRAARSAASLLEGAQSEFFKVLTSGDGMLRIQRVRFSGRDKARKRSKSGGLLRGGRYGNKFAAGSLKASEVAKKDLQRALATNGSIKRLNLGSLSAAIELSLRQRAAKGGTLAVQWLPRVYARRRSSVVKNGPLIVNSPTGYELGRVDFFQKDGDLQSIRLSANAPGTGKVLVERGVFERVLAARRADRMDYVRRKLAEAKSQARFRSN